MWNTVLPALIAAVAALGGVTVGALVEPLKLGAARRARVRQDRLERCVELIEAANQVGGMAVGINRAFRGEHPSASLPEGEPWDVFSRSYYEARTRLLTVVGVLRILGPEVLAEAAEQVRAADVAVAKVRFVADGDATENGRPVSTPPALREATHALRVSVAEFEVIAAQCVR